MDKVRSVFVSNRARAARTGPLRGAVRRALGLSTGVIAAGLALGTVPPASAASFPPVFPLASLLPAGGGDGSAGFVLAGIDETDWSGYSVSDAGDVNGDGIGDVIVGAHLADPGGRGEAGESHIVFGRDTAQAGNFPAVFPLARLLPPGGGDGSAGFVITGIDADDVSGKSVSAAGDVNGDGISDLIVGAELADPGGQSAAGESYVVFGRDTAQAGNFPAVFPLALLLPGGGGDGSAGFVIAGIDRDDRSGGSVNAAGDINGDGIGDLILGARTAPGDRSDIGRSYVVFGRDTAQSGNFPAVFPLAGLLPDGGGDGSAGFVLEGIRINDLSGESVSAAGDVNSDGIGDLVIGAPGANDDRGESYVVFGRDTAQSGLFPAEFELSSLLPANGGDGSTGFVLTGIRINDYSGRSVSAAGDINGDGIGDLILGAANARPGGLQRAGESYVVFGRDTAQAGNFPARFELSSLLAANGGDGSAGVVLAGIHSFDYTGRSVSAAGDVNGDGIGDLIVGADYSDLGGQNTGGASYVVFGRDTAQSGLFPPEFALSSLLPGGGGDGSAGFVLTGTHPGERSGKSVSAAGDINRDGIGDLMIGAYFAQPGGRRGAGASYVVLGRNSAH